jgi:AcrR family transcriptional regulator
LADNEDRRVRRTRRALRAALLELVTERGYDKVTVQDVLDRADVGRSTFYAHFRDKDALFASCFDDLRAGLQRDLDHAAGHPRNGTQPLGVIFEHAYRNQAVYQAVGVAHLHGLLFDALLEHLRGGPVRQPAEIVAEYHASALVGVLGWWVRAGFPYGPAEMSRICLEVTQPSMMAAMVRDHQPSAKMGT